MKKLLLIIATTGMLSLFSCEKEESCNTCEFADGTSQEYCEEDYGTDALPQLKATCLQSNGTWK